MEGKAYAEAKDVEITLTKEVFALSDYAAEKDACSNQTHSKGPSIEVEGRRFVLQIGYPWHYHYLRLRKRAII
eukprot:scaffold4735_cov104-Skeletonema_dohrnii-CCMP3373.AAC.11